MAGSSADAQVVARLRFEPIGGPVIAGDSVVWAEGRFPRGFVVRAVRGGGVSTLLTNKGLYRPAVHREVNLAASPDLVAAEYVQFHDDGLPIGPLMVRSLTYAGAPSGPLSLVGTGCTVSADQILRSVDVSGDQVIFPVRRGTDASGAQQCGTDVARPLAPGASPEALPAAAPQALRLAGSFAAWLEGAPVEDQPNDVLRVVVFDRASGQPRSDLEPGALPASVYALALQPSGTAVLGYGAVDGDGWHGGGLAELPPGAAATLLPVPAGHYIPRLAGDRLVVLTSPQGAGTAVVEELDLAGCLVAVLSRNAYDDVYAEHVDAQG